MTLPKKQIIRSMTVNEISSVDTPAVKGATAVLLKSAGAALRKNAAEVRGVTASLLPPSVCILGISSVAGNKEPDLLAN